MNYIWTTVRYKYFSRTLELNMSKSCCFFESSINLLPPLKKIQSEIWVIQLFGYFYLYIKCVWHLYMTQILKKNLPPKLIYCIFISSVIYINNVGWCTKLWKQFLVFHRHNSIVIFSHYKDLYASIRMTDIFYLKL